MNNELNPQAMEVAKILDYCMTTKKVIFCTFYYANKYDDKDFSLQVEYQGARVEIRTLEKLKNVIKLIDELGEA